jgi:hypothetical protein
MLEDVLNSQAFSAAQEVFGVEVDLADARAVLELVYEQRPLGPFLVDLLLGNDSYIADRIRAVAFSAVEQDHAHRNADTLLGTLHLVASDVDDVRVTPELLFAADTLVRLLHPWHSASEIEGIRASRPLVADYLNSRPAEVLAALQSDELLRIVSQLVAEHTELELPATR